MAKYIAKTDSWVTPTETIGSIQNNGNGVIEISSQNVENTGIRIAEGQIVSYEGVVYVRSVGNRDCTFTTVPFKVDGKGGGGGGYILPTMSSSVKGGAKLGETLKVVGDTLDVSDDIARNGIVEWERDTNYSSGDVVIFRDKIYVCKKSHTSGKEFYIDNWSMNVERNVSVSKITRYLYEINLGIIDYTLAKEYFENLDSINLGMCSSVRSGNFYGRNYDWLYDNTVSFIARTKGGNGRYKSIGICSMSQLTDDVVESGEYSNYYAILPFFMQDGINEHGVVANVNVVPSDYGRTTSTVPSVEFREKICSVMLVRYIIDNFKSAKEAVEYIRDYVSVYTPNFLADKDYELHFMVADAEDTYIVEFIGNAIVIIDASDKPYMTNFYIANVSFNDDGTVYTPGTMDETHNAITTNNITAYGSGLERYNLIASHQEGADSLARMTTLMKSLAFTNAYKLSTVPFWYTEFVGIDIDGTEKTNVITETEVYDEKIVPYMQKYDKRSRNPLDENYGTWQTVHSSVYDIEKRKLFVLSQEAESGYTKYLNFEFND